MKKSKLQEILKLHSLWLEGDRAGVKADLRGCNLSGADLSLAYLNDADLSKSNLSGAILHNTFLRYTELIGFYLGKQFGFAHFSTKYKEGNIVRIGSDEMSVQDWLDNYLEMLNKYDTYHINLYGLQLNMIQKAFKIYKQRR